MIRKWKYKSGKHLEQRRATDTLTRATPQQSTQMRLPTNPFTSSSPSSPTFPLSLIKLLSTTTSSLPPSPPPFAPLFHRHRPYLPRSPITSGHFSFRSRFTEVRVSAMSTGADYTNVVSFALSPSSSLKIQKGDITTWFVDGSSDAIVNAANERMLGGGGVDGAIHRAAGPELKEACYKVPEVRPGVRCPTGDARITPGFKLPASHVIHTVGPMYDVDKNPAASLKNAYKNSLCIARENKIQYVAFPAISCGVFRYPIDEAASIAISTIKEFANDFKEVHFVLFSDDIYQVWQEKAHEIVGK